MNSLLEKAGIPQFNARQICSGYFVYEKKIPGSRPFTNYHSAASKVEVECAFQRLNALAVTGGLRG